MNSYIYSTSSLYHYGIPGMKWGVRKRSDEYMRMRSARDNYRLAKKSSSRAFNKASNFSSAHFITQNIKKHKNYKKSNDLWGDVHDKFKAEANAKDAYKKSKAAYKNSEEYKERKAKLKKAAKIGAAVAVAGLAVYGAYKLNKTRQTNQALVARFIENEGYYPVKTITERGKSKAQAFGKTLRSMTTKQDKITNGLLGPSIKRTTQEKGFVGGNRTWYKNNVTGAGHKQFGIINKKDVKDYSKLYKSYKKSGRI